MTQQDTLALVFAPAIKRISGRWPTRASLRVRPLLIRNAVSTAITANPSNTCYTRRMIADRDRRIIEEIAAKYHVKHVVLFGSSLSPDKDSRDIDIGVEGIEEKDFFTFYGELLCALSKPVDVVDLSTKSRFVELIRLEGIPLYA